MAASTRKLATFATGSTPRLVAARSVRVFPSSEPTSRPSRTPVNLACSGRVARATASGPGKLLQTHSPSAAPLLPLTFAPSNVHRDDPPFFTSPQHPPAGPISPEEYRLRLGRALDLLRATLPDLLRIGIADYDHSSASQAERSAALGPVFSNNIHFRFLPSPEHDDEPGSAADAAAAAANLGFSGRGLYLASAHVLRHALSAIFAEGRVDLERIKLVDGSGKPCSAAMASLPAAVAQHDSSSNATKQASTTKHAILARITYSGKLRVTGQPQSYTLRFRYEFDHLGQINLHVVERIEPAVGRKLWAGLTHAFMRLAGLAPPNPHPVPSHIVSRHPRTFLQSAAGSLRSPDERRMMHTSAPRLDVGGDSQYKVGQIERKLALSFTCTVPNCGHRSAHEFTARAYQKGIVIVECPGCKNRHLIADHLGWFKDSNEARTVEEMVRAHGGRVRTGTKASDGQGGTTIEIESDEGSGGGAGEGASVVDDGSNQKPNP